MSPAECATVTSPPSPPAPALPTTEIETFLRIDVGSVPGIGKT
jgi:hypothetical protein